MCLFVLDSQPLPTKNSSCLFTTAEWIDVANKFGTCRNSLHRAQAHTTAVALDEFDRYDNCKADQVTVVVKSIEDAIEIGALQPRQHRRCSPNLRERRCTTTRATAYTACSGWLHRSKSAYVS